ncbi:MAG: hypothetical protein WD577_14165 [Bacteroidales bacterium]
MKTKKEHIAFWITQADDDWAAVATLFQGGNYLQSLFFAHTSPKCTVSVISHLQLQ